MTTDIIITCTSQDKVEQAKIFAEKHHYPFSEQLPVGASFYLSFDDDLPTLYDESNNISMTIDFTGGGLTHRLQYGGGKGQTIAKAIGITSKNKPHILDATAGLGRDALILASLGCQLSLVEQSPILAKMIDQAILFAQDNALFKQTTRHGFKLYHADAARFMNEQNIPGTDVVYLDPMYPEKKKSALVKKDMQMLQNLIGHSSDQTNAHLLAAAINFATQRVVVKRPKGADQIEGPTPTMSLHSKKTRYDVYVVKTLKK